MKAKILPFLKCIVAMHTCEHIGLSRTGGVLAAGNPGEMYDSAAAVPEGLLSVILPPYIFQNLTNDNNTLNSTGEASNTRTNNDTVSVLFNTYDSSILFPISNETQYTLANISDSELVSQFQVASSLVSATVIGHDVRNLPNNTKVTILLRLQSNVSHTC